MTPVAPSACNKSIKIGSLNVCGLINRLKIPEFIKLINKYDVFVCSEGLKIALCGIFYPQNKKIGSLFQGAENTNVFFSEFCLFISVCGKRIN